MDIRCQGFARRVFTLLAVSFLGFPLFLSAAESPVAVLYPETTRPVRAVFDEILRGIDEAARDVDTARYRVNAGRNGEGLRQFLATTQPAAVITLGRTPYQLYRSVRDAHPRAIVGALDATPDTHPDTRGIGLGVDPALLFQRLKRVSPATQRVLVAYDPSRDASTIELAKTAARQSGLVLRAYEASNLSESSVHYWNIFQYANPATDALWLTIDANLVNETANLPRIIEESWSRHMVVFSNNLAHADKGVLFALYPDPYALGQRLFRLSQEGPSDERVIRPLRDVKSALNNRIADHLNLPLPATTRRLFDLQLEGR